MRHPDRPAPPQDLDIGGRSPWTTLRVTRHYENPWIRVDEHDVLTPSGTPGIYGVVYFKKLAVGVLPLDDAGFTYIVGQYRYALRQYSWEMPEGGGDPAVAPQDSAARELREETGLVARHWREVIGTLHLSNSVTDERAVSFLAWGLEPGTAAPDETEQLEVRRVPFATLFDMVWRGAVTDSLTVATVLKARLMAARGELPAEVAAGLLAEPA